MRNMHRTDGRKQRFSLSTYISILLALTATIPLIVTIGSLEFFLRPALISQASTSLESNAQTQMQLIDIYLSDRLNDVNTLSQSEALKQFLEGNVKEAAAAENTLTDTQHEDASNYINLSLINAQGNVALFYPATPLKHGQYLIVPEALQHLQKSGQAFVSDVFYDPVGNVPSIDLYARVTDENDHISGYVRRFARPTAYLEFSRYRSIWQQKLYPGSKWCAHCLYEEQRLRIYAFQFSLYIRCSTLYTLETSDQHRGPVWE